MVVCPSGSTTKAGTPEYMVITQDIIAAIPELAWLVPYFKYVQPLPEVMSTFCASDPPDMPTLDPFDLISLLSGSRTSAALSGLQKLTQLTQVIAWYQLCECVSTTTPAMPAAPSAPADLPVVYPTEPGAAYIVMKAADVKVLSLWNGSSNISAPNGWYLPAFDDSGWSSPTLYTGSTGIVFGHTYQNGLELTPVHDAVSFGADKLDPHVFASAQRQQFLVRWRPVVPPLTSTSIAFSMNYHVGAGPSGWGSGLISVNGFAPQVIFNTTPYTTLAAQVAPGGRNLIAFHVDSGAGATPSSDLWDNTSWYSAMLESSGSAALPFGDDCCARTESLLLDLQQRLQAVADYVTLIQRQQVPFAYVPGTVHSGLTGSGELTVTGLLGAKVAPTAIPGWAGIQAGDPQELWLNSWLRWGNDDGWIEREFLRASPHVSLPRYAGQFTKLGYTLHPGLEVTITELEREP